MKKRQFFKNAAILTATSFVLRLIGILFRIYISNRVGAEGMGLYQLIISVYVLASSFATAGLCTAVTRLCADEMIRGTVRSVKRVVSLCITLSIVVGVASGIVILLGVNVVSMAFIGDIRAIPSLKILTVSLPFMGISSCLRGYFTARRRLLSPSLSQILEQAVRIGTIALLLNTVDSLSVEKACFIILLGDTVAEGISCLFMYISYAFDKRHLENGHEKEPTRLTQFKQTIHIALPITSGRYINSALRAFENSIVPRALDHVTRSRALSLAQFGKLKGMAMPLLFFPSSFLTAFSTLLIPEISQAKLLSEHRQLNHTIGKAFHVTLLSSYLIGGIFWTLSAPLADIIYGDAEVGVMIRILAPLTPIMYLESVVVGILKGLDQQSHSLFYSVLDSVIRIFLILLITPKHGINGFFGVMVVSNVLTCVLNTWRLCRVTHFSLLYGKWIVRPIIAVMLSVTIISAFSVPAVTPFWDCVIRGSILCCVYTVLLVLFKCIRKDDFSMFKRAKKRHSR